MTEKAAHTAIDIEGRAALVKKPGAGQTALITDYGTLDHYLGIYEKNYEEKRADFFDSVAEDQDLPDKAKRWESASKTYLSFARTLMKAYGEEDKYYGIAQEIADRVTKESAIRLSNLDLHYELMKKVYPKGDDRLIRLSKKVEDGMNFFSRAIATQTVIIHRVDAMTGGPAGIELKEEEKAGERARALEEKVTDGHIFLPARPFPALPIPAGRKVQEYPEPYQRYKEIPVEDLIFDEEHDEFIIRPGYVSEDGLIDDESVVWNWEEGTVAIKFRGGEPEIWPFWKPKDETDIPTGWTAEYLYRKFVDWADSLDRGILKRK